MSERALLVRFVAHLTRYDLPEWDRPHGPLFYRWLPGGLDDAIHVPMQDKTNQLRLWFKRTGFAKDGWIEFDSSRTEVDPSIMRRQARLDAGSLRGELVLGRITQSELKAVKENMTNSDEYVAVGKRACDLISGPIIYLVELLRAQYGQFWISEFEKWDSRTHSLGSYCSGQLGLWWLDSDGTWHAFHPTDPMVSDSLVWGDASFNEYLTQDDWIVIQDRFSSSDPFGSKDSGATRIPLALQLIGKAHELHASGHVRQAIIDATTALEIAIGSFLRDCGIDPLYQDEFEKCRLPLRLVIVAQASRAVDAQLLKKASEGIEMRNKIVHEGANPREDYLSKLAAMMKCAVILLGFKHHKTPNLIRGNFLHAPEDTEATSGRGDVA